MHSNVVIGGSLDSCKNCGKMFWIENLNNGFCQNCGSKIRNFFENKKSMKFNETIKEIIKKKQEVLDGWQSAISILEEEVKRLENNMKKQIVDKDIILQRSKTYGNNFPFLAKIWNNYFKQKYGNDFQITPEDTAIMLCLLKVSRLANNPSDSDTLKDMLNYAWLGIDYDQYVKELGMGQKTESFGYTKDQCCIEDKEVEKLLKQFKKDKYLEPSSIKEVIQYLKNQGYIEQNQQEDDSICDDEDDCKFNNIEDVQDFLNSYDQELQEDFDEDGLEDFDEEDIDGFDDEYPCFYFGRNCVFFDTKQKKLMHACPKGYTSFEICELIYNNT